MVEIFELFSIGILFVISVCLIAWLIKKQITHFLKDKSVLRYSNEYEKEFNEEVKNYLI